MTARAQKFGSSLVVRLTVSSVPSAQAARSGACPSILEQNQDIQIGLADPYGSALYHHYQHGSLKADGGSISEGIGQGRITANLDGITVDRAYQISDEEALPIIYDLMQHEGLFLGGSSAINIAGAMKMARDLGPGHRIVTILCEFRSKISVKSVEPRFLTFQEFACAILVGDIIMSYLVSAEWLITHLNDDNLFIFDATFVLPTMERDAAAEFEQTHIPGAQFFDINAIADTSSDLPHMVPSAADFSHMMQELGLLGHHKVVIYDNSPFLSAARAWWLLRLFGKADVFVLNGGLPAPMSKQVAQLRMVQHSRETGDFTAAPALAQLILFDELRRQIEAGNNLQILDARPAPRFHGHAAEPRPGLRAGHMPGAMNVPVTALLNKQTGTLKVI